MLPGLECMKINLRLHNFPLLEAQESVWTRRNMFHCHCRVLLEKRKCQRKVDDASKRLARGGGKQDQVLKLQHN